MRSSAIHSEIAPLVVEMLQAGGFDASVSFGVDASHSLREGQPGRELYGHGASLPDPYATLALYHSRSSRPTTQPASDGYSSRYTNPRDDTLLKADSPGSLEICWKDQFDIPVMQRLHRIPSNQTS